MDLDPNTHRDLARFVARRYPKPEQRRDFAERARVHCPEPPQTRAEVAWGVLLSRAVEQRRIRQLLEAILRDSSADSQLQEVCTLVLGRPWPPPPPLLGPTRARWLGGALALAGGSMGAWLVVDNLDPEPDPPSVYEAALQVQEAALGPSAAAHAHLPAAADGPSDPSAAPGLPASAHTNTPPATADSKDVETAETAKTEAERAEAAKAEAEKTAAAKAEAEKNAAAKAEAAKAEAAKAEAAKAEAAKAEAAKAEAAKIAAAKAEAAKAEAAKIAAAKAEAAKAEAAKAEAAKIAAAKAEAAKAEAAKIAAAKAETQAKTAAASAQVRPPAASPSQAALTTPPTSPSSSRGGRCTSPQGGLIGWWYAGDTPPGKQGEIVVMDRSAYVRTDLPTAANGYKVGSASPCSVVRGDRLRLTGAPVQIPGGKWWVPIHSGDILK